MSVASVRQGREVFRTVEVRDPSGHNSVILEGLSASVSIAEVRARAQSELRLPSDVPWNLRDDGTGRLLQDSQRLNEFIGENSTLVELSMQPDAGLG
jgi:hypothetical protein